MQALATIIRGRAGHAFFEIFNSTYDEPNGIWIVKPGGFICADFSWSVE